MKIRISLPEPLRQLSHNLPTKISRNAETRHTTINTTITPVVITIESRRNLSSEPDFKSPNRNTDKKVDYFLLFTVSPYMLTHPSRNCPFQNQFPG